MNIHGYKLKHKNITKLLKREEKLNPLKVKRLKKAKANCARKIEELKKAKQSKKRK